FADDMSVRRHLDPAQSKVAILKAMPLQHALWQMASIGCEGEEAIECRYIDAISALAPLQVATENPDRSHGLREINPLSIGHAYTGIEIRQRHCCKFTHCQRLRMRRQRHAEHLEEIVVGES